MAVVLRLQHCRSRGSHLGGPRVAAALAGMDLLVPLPPACRQPPHYLLHSSSHRRCAAQTSTPSPPAAAQLLWLQPWRRQHRAVRCRGQGGSDGGSIDGVGSTEGSGNGGSSIDGGGASTKGGNGGGGGGSNDNGDWVQNLELLTGDCLCLVCFALYKQITSIILSPAFPGWLAPLAFSPTRFLEFFSFGATLLGTWVASGLLVGGYRYAATADAPAALSRTCLMWFISMPVAAAQLVLLTAAEDVALVGDVGFASRLPLAATGPGEPFVTAAGVLGLMCVWRAFYAVFLDIYSFGKMQANRRSRQQEMEHFADSLRGAMLLSLACCAVLQFLGSLVGEEELESLLGPLVAAGSSL